MNYNFKVTLTLKFAACGEAAPSFARFGLTIKVIK